jgi:hypothetical protein
MCTNVISRAAAASTLTQLEVQARVARLDLPGDAARVTKASDADAVILFVTDSRALPGTGTASALAAAKEDRLGWVLYPKAGQLGTDLNRDRLADALRARGVRPVRQVSVDDVWPALRFRPAESST